MKNSSSNDWLIPLLAAFAIYIPLSTTAPSPDQQSSAQPQSPALIQMVPAATPTPTPGPGRVSGEAARLLCDFFGLEPDQSQKVGLNPQQKSEIETWRGDYCRIKSVLNSKVSKRPPPSGYGEIEYLIATVPDPKDTRLDHQFDRALDAIRRALESADYTFDRFWLPWDRWGRHLAIGVAAFMILVFTLGAFIWLMVGVSMWMISGWRHFHGRIWVLLGLVVCAATITFVGLGLFKVYFGFETPEKVFFFLRATELTSGVSVLLPALLTGKSPGKVNVTRDLVFRVLIHAVVPVIALLGVQFPEAVRQIFSWLNFFEGRGS
jgi:hypothetical protein